MANPTFGSRSLQDDTNYFTEDVQYRTTAPKDMRLMPVARRPGAKIIANEHREKRIVLKGWVMGDTSSDLQDKVDDLQQDLHKEEQTLTIESGRNYTATLASLVIPDVHYNTTMVPFEAEFVCAEPFAEGTAQSAVFTVPSGMAEVDETITISGTVFAEPTITYTAPGSSGDTTTSGITIRNVTRGERVSWSGTGSDPTVDYGSNVSFNYKTLQCQVDSGDKDHTGKFSRFEPGSNRLVISFSGLAMGGNVQVSYSPRYY